MNSNLIERVGIVLEWILSVAIAAIGLLYLVNGQVLFGILAVAIAAVVFPPTEAHPVIRFLAIVFSLFGL